MLLGARRLFLAMPVGTRIVQPAIGGLVIGALVGLIFARTRAVRRQRRQLVLLIVTTVALIALLAVPVVAPDLILV